MGMSASSKPSTTSAKPLVLTINGGSSSIKFAFFEVGDALVRVISGQIERIGQADAVLRVKGLNEAASFLRPVRAPDHTGAVNALMDWIEERAGSETLAAIGHRVVHGGPTYSEPQRITSVMVEKLRTLSPFDPEHLP
jgi:acetate kinase